MDDLYWQHMVAVKKGSGAMPVLALAASTLLKILGFSTADALAQFLFGNTVSGTIVKAFIENWERKFQYDGADKDRIPFDQAFFMEMLKVDSAAWTYLRCLTLPDTVREKARPTLCWFVAIHILIKCTPGIFRGREGPNPTVTGKKVNGYIFADWDRARHVLRFAQMHANAGRPDITTLELPANPSGPLNIQDIAVKSENPSISSTHDISRIDSPLGFMMSADDKDAQTATPDGRRELKVIEASRDFLAVEGEDKLNEFWCSSVLVSGE